MLSKISSLSLIASASAAGTCPDVPVVENFDKASYIGRWYEIERSRTQPFEWFGECTTATYGALEDGNISVTNRGWFFWTLGYNSTNAFAVCPKADEGKCHVD